MKRSASGERLWRDMRVTVCLPEQKDIVWRNHAKARHGWTVEQLNEMLEKVADSVEQKFPSIEFRLVELAPNDFKFIYSGRKERMVTKELADNLNSCPDVARSPKIAEEVCANLGHKLSTYQNGTTMTPNGPQMNVINFCSACGLSLSEVRGEIDQRINAAVEHGILERLKAAGNKPAPPPPGATAGPFAVPKDLPRGVGSRVDEAGHTLQSGAPIVESAT